MKTKPWFIITDYDPELRQYVAVLNGASTEIGYGDRADHAVYDLLHEVNRVGLDASQYRWGMA